MTARPREPRARAMDVGGERLLVVATPSPMPPSIAALSAAEREVAAAILRGLSNAEIARERGVAVRTVANQVSALFRKLGVGSRAELAVLSTRGQP
ncbi:MAG: helix-turn-helix transcriptional regulator [Sandaracinus sp.]